MALILECDTVTILPNPQLSDSRQSRNTMTLRRTMTGVRITYVKANARKRFVWSFKLTLEKAFELRAFVERYGHRLIRVSENNSEFWTGYIMSNPIEFNHSDYTPGCKEMVDVTLEFEAK